jgi:hypothetical protein
VDERAAAVRSELELERKHCHHIEELRTAATCKAKVGCSRGGETREYCKQQEMSPQKSESAVIAYAP